MVIKAVSPAPTNTPTLVDRMASLPRNVICDVPEPADYGTIWKASPNVVETASYVPVSRRATPVLLLSIGDVRRKIAVAAE